MKALIIVDWEKEWTDSDSEYYIGSDLGESTSNLNQLIAKFRENNDKIIFVRHCESEGTAFQENSENTKFINNLDVQSGDTIITKFKISPFYNTNLEQELNGIDEIIVAGILTNLCVRSTVSDAYDRDYKITIIDDCCVAFDKETHEFTLKDLKFTRPEIEIMTLSDFLN